MKLSNFILAGMLVLSSTTYADCSQPVSYLKKNESAPCDGYLFTPEKEKEVREIVLKYPTMVELLEKQDHLITTLNNRVEINQNIAENLREEVKITKNNSMLTNIVYFFLGVAVAVGVNKVAK